MFFQNKKRLLLRIREMFYYEDEVSHNEPEYKGSPGEHSLFLIKKRSVFGFTYSLAHCTQTSLPISYLTT